MEALPNHLPASLRKVKLHTIEVCMFQGPGVYKTFCAQLGTLLLTLHYPITTLRVVLVYISFSFDVLCAL